MLAPAGWTLCPRAHAEAGPGELDVSGQLPRLVGMQDGWVGAGEPGPTVSTPQGCAQDLGPPG